MVVIRLRRRWLALAAATGMLLFLAGGAWFHRAVEEVALEGDFIKWVDFNVTYPVLERAMELDIASQESEIPVNWIDLLAYAAAETGNQFDNYSPSRLDALAEKLQRGESMEHLTRSMPYYDYYRTAYTAVLGGFLGEFEEEGADGTQLCYGLKAFSPIAAGFHYTDYDDFGVSRSYGFSRPHQGHDMMGNTGTPIIAVESGRVEALGWNQYGGWRIGIRSLDNKRYYYYAHLRKDFPYQLDLKEGDTVTAGDVIGYMGRTGYSLTENVNNIDTTHLHFGMQLIFDESQKETDSGEIWIDVYPIVQLLARHRSAVTRNVETKEYDRTYSFRDLSAVG